MLVIMDQDIELLAGDDALLDGDSEGLTGKGLRARSPGKELGAGVAAHQPVTDLGQPIRLGDRRQHVGQASGGIVSEARRRHPAQERQAHESDADGISAAVAADSGRKVMLGVDVGPRRGPARVVP